MLDQVQKPTRYTGGEMNTQLKPWDSAKLHFAFCFPDTYEVGMSHLGMKILYAAMNQQPDMLCERAFMPWVDMMDLMKQENVPLFTLESRSPLSAFDVVGFTLQYEMSYSNILAMLELGGIPLLREIAGRKTRLWLRAGRARSIPNRWRILLTRSWSATAKSRSSTSTASSCRGAKRVRAA